MRWSRCAGLRSLRERAGQTNDLRAVQDLQLQPAFALPSTEAVSRAIELAYDRDFSHIPVLDKRRRPLGYVDVAKLKKTWEAGGADPVRGSMSRLRLRLTGSWHLSFIPHRLFTHTHI